jgi:hypothetical protein
VLFFCFLFPAVKQRHNITFFMSLGDKATGTEELYYVGQAIWQVIRGDPLTLDRDANPFRLANSGKIYWRLPGKLTLSKFVGNARIAEIQTGIYPNLDIGAYPFVVVRTSASPLCFLRLRCLSFVN